MGQVTLPVINRKGYSDIWESSWINNSIHTNLINEDIFIKNFLKIFLKNWASFAHLNKATFSKQLKKKNFRKERFIFYDYVRHVILEQNLVEFFRKKNLKKFPYYTAKIFVAKFSSWIIIYTYVYVPRPWKKRFVLKQQKQYNYSYINDLYSYHTAKLNFLSSN